MKNFVTTFLFVCICILNSYAQGNLLYDGIQQAKSSGEKFESISVLTLANKSVLQSAKIQENFINPLEVHVLHYSKPAEKNLNTSMMLLLPLDGKNLQLELQEFTMEYQLTTSDYQKISPNRNNRHYHGIVKWYIMTNKK